MLNFDQILYRPRHTYQNSSFTVAILEELMYSINQFYFTSINYFTSKTPFLAIMGEYLGFKLLPISYTSNKLKNFECKFFLENQKFIFFTCLEGIDDIPLAELISKNPQKLNHFL